MSRKLSSVLNYNILIGNNAIKLTVFTDIGVLKKNTILDNRSLTYLYATEDNGITNFALENSTVCKK